MTRLIVGTIDKYNENIYDAVIINDDFKIYITIKVNITAPKYELISVNSIFINKAIYDSNINTDFTYISSYDIPESLKPYGLEFSKVISIHTNNFIDSSNFKYDKNIIQKIINKI